MECPEEMTREPVEEPPETRVMVRAEDWGPVARVLVARGVMEATRGKDIPRWKGRLMVNGLFVVH